MDPIGLSQPIVIAKVLPTPGSGGTPVVPAAPQVQQPDTTDTTQQQVGLDPQSAEQKRLEAVQKAAQDIANIYVVGDKRFTIFKDISGQYITRFTSLRDGSVTYIPEPQIFKMSGGSGSDPALLKINA